MGLKEELEAIRDASKATKKEHLEYLIKEAVKNRTYVAFYGFLGEEDLQETTEEITKIKNELGYNYVLTQENIKGESVTISLDQKEIARFPNKIKIAIDRK